jgi:hypothetical protein
MAKWRCGRCEDGKSFMFDAKAPPTCPRCGKNQEHLIELASPDIHWHAAGSPTWACGTRAGQATGRTDQVTCADCLAIIPPPPQTVKEPPTPTPPGSPTVKASADEIAAEVASGHY